MPLSRRAFHLPAGVRTPEFGDRTYAALLFVSLTADFSVYVGNVAHVYVHDLASVAVALLGVATAVRNGSAIPRRRRLLVPLAFLVFLAANSALVAAAIYPGVPNELRKLFWYEHGDALRMLSELFVWVWTLGVMRPKSREALAIWDTAGWGCAVAVVWTGMSWYMSNSRPLATTIFDLYVLVGLPIGLYFVITRTHRSDLVRLFAFGLATTLLYSRTTIVAVGVASVIALALSWRRRESTLAIACIVGAWIAVFASGPVGAVLARSTPANSAAPSPAPSPAAPSPAAPAAAVVTSAAPSAASQVIGGAVAVERAGSIVDQRLAPYTIPSRSVIWADALRMAGLSPATGIGYHDYFLFSHVTELKTGSELDPPDLHSSLIKQAHNDFLSALAETGVPGLVFYIFFWIFVLLELNRLRGSATMQSHQAAIALALALGLLSVSFIGEILIPRAASWTSAAVLWWLVLTMPLLSSEEAAVSA